MALGGTPTLVLAVFAADRLQSILVTGAAPPYQALTGVLVHALANGFFWLSAWLMAAAAPSPWTGTTKPPPVLDKGSFF